MRKKQRRRQERKRILTILVMLVLAISLLKIGRSYAGQDSLEVKKVELLSYAGDTSIENLAYLNGKIISNIKFHKLGDSVTYKIVIRNNDDKQYVINDIGVIDPNEYISYEFKDCKGDMIPAKGEKAFELTEKYDKEIEDIEKRNQRFDVKLNIEFEDYDGNTENFNVSAIGSSINPTGTERANGGTVGLSTNNGGYYYGTSSNSSGYGILIPQDFCDINNGKMTITATVKYWMGDGAVGTDKPEAIGFGLTQVSTGKTLRINTNREGNVWMSTGASVSGNLNGWGRRIFPAKSGLPNWKDTSLTTAVSRDKAGTLNVKMEVSGETWKFWASLGNFTDAPNVTVKAQEFYYTSAQTATGGASEKAKTDGCNALPDLKADGLVIPNVVVFGDGKCAWEIKDVNVDYVPNN